MKTLSTTKRSVCAFILTATMAAFTSFAQPGPGAGGPPGMSPDLTKYFGANTSFTAKAEITIQRPGQQDNMTIVMSMFMLDGQTRAEMDVSQIVGAKIPAEAIAQMKQMGMDKMTSMALPAKKMNLVIYPGLQAYAEIPMTGSQAAEADKKFTLEKTSMGKETIDGHACVKNKVVATDNEGKKQEAIVWNASDMKDFPIQLQMVDRETTVLMKFKEVKIEKPDAKNFVIPADYKKYPTMQALMQGEMMKRMAPGNAPGK